MQIDLGEATVCLSGIKTVVKLFCAGSVTGKKQEVFISPDPRQGSQRGFHADTEKEA